MGNNGGKQTKGDGDYEYGGDDWTEYSENSDPQYKSASDDESRASSVRREFARSNTPRFGGGSTQPPTLRTDNSFMNRSVSQSSLSDVYSLDGLQSASAVGVPANRNPRPGMFQVPEGAENATRLIAAGPRIPGQPATGQQVRKITVVHKQLPDGSYDQGVAMESPPENLTHREVAPPLNNPPPNMIMSPPRGLAPGYRTAQPPPDQTRHLPPAPPPPMSPQANGALIYDDSRELSLPPISSSFKPYTGSTENVPSLYEEPVSFGDQHSDTSYRSTQQAIRDHMYDNNVGESEHDTMQRRPVSTYTPHPPASPPPPPQQPQARLGNAEVQVSIHEGSSHPGTRSHTEASHAPSHALSHVECTAIVPREPKKKKKKCKPKLPSDYTVTKEVVTEEAVVLRPRAGPGRRHNCVKSVKEEAVILKKRQGPHKPKTKTQKDQVWVLERRRSPVREVIREVYRDRTPQSDVPSSSQDSERVVIQPVMVPVYYNQEPQPTPEPIIKTRTVIQPIIIKQGRDYSETGSSRSGHRKKGHKKRSGGSHSQSSKGTVSSSRTANEIIVQPIKGDMILKKPSDHSYENNPIVVPLSQDSQSEVSSGGGGPSGGIVAEVEVGGGGDSARYYNLRHVKDSIGAASSRRSRDSTNLAPPTTTKHFGTVSSEVPSFISPERPGDSVRVIYHTHLQANGQDMAQDWELDEQRTDDGNQGRSSGFNPGSTRRSMPVLPEIIVDPEPEPGDSVSQKGDTLRSRSSKASSSRSRDVTRKAAALSRELTGDEEQENRPPSSASSVSSSMTSSVTRRQSDSSSSITSTTARRTLATTTDSSTEQGTSTRDMTTKTSESTTDRSSTTSSSSSTTRRRRTLTSSSQSSSTNDRSSTTSSRSSSRSSTTATRTLTRRTADEDDDGDESDSTLKAEEEDEDMGRQPNHVGSFVKKMRERIRGVFGGALDYAR